MPKPIDNQTIVINHQGDKRLKDTGIKKPSKKHVALLNLDNDDVLRDENLKIGANLKLLSLWLGIALLARKLSIKAG